MPRIAREIVFNESKFCHILVQGIAKEYIFESAMLKNFYLKCLSEKQAEFKISILAFCIMGNHSHLLITADDTKNISLFIKKVNTTYAKYYNKTQKRVGYVFRNRFRAEALTDEKYLINCISYIHNNPVKAKLCETAENYEFSSATNYKNKQGIIDFEKLKEIFGEIPNSINKSVETFIDDKLESMEDYDKVLEEIIHKYNISSNKSLQSDEVLYNVANELKIRTGKSLRELANLLEINRERLRKVMSSFTSP